MRLPLRVTAILVLVCSLLCSCTSNNYLHSPLDANRSIITDHAEIVLRSGFHIEAVDIKVGIDSTQYKLIETDSLRQISTDAIEKLIVTHHFAGAFGGLVAGSVGGLAGGIVFGALILTSPDKSSGGQQAWNILYSGAAGLIVGSIGGTIYGAMHGFRECYLLPPDSIKDLTQRCVTGTSDRRLVRSIHEEIR